MAPAGATLSEEFRVGDRNPQRAKGVEQVATRERGQHGRALSRVGFGQKQFLPRGRQ